MRPRTVSVFLFFILFSVSSVAISLEHQINYCETNNYNIDECYEIWDWQQSCETNQTACEIVVNESTYIHNYTYSVITNKTYMLNNTYYINNTLRPNITVNNSINLTPMVNYTQIDNCSLESNSELLDHEYRMYMAEQGLVPEQYCQNITVCEECDCESYFSREEYMVLNSEYRSCLNMLNQTGSSNLSMSGALPYFLIGVIVVVGLLYLGFKKGLIGKSKQDTGYRPVPKRKSFDQAKKEGDTHDQKEIEL